jgi:hypothetical protein
VGYAVAALEIVDSRIANWDISITDTIADKASSSLFVLAGQPLTLDEFEPREVTMRMYADDALVSEGNGRACLGDSLNARGSGDGPGSISPPLVPDLRRDRPGRAGDYQAAGEA